MQKSLLLLGAAALAAIGASAPKSVSPEDLAGIRAAFERHQQLITPSVKGHTARNLGQGWNTRFDGRGFEVTPASPEWTWGLALQSYGFPGNLRQVKSATATPNQDRFSYQWDTNLQEWFVNRSSGLEHGFTVASRPGGKNAGEPLVFHLDVRGPLAPSVSADGRNVTFANGAGAAVVNYAGLKVLDADGRELAARFHTQGHGLRLEIQEQGARYPVTVDPVASQANLKPSAVGASQVGDQMGKSVAIDGNTAVVGAPFELSSSTGINSTPNELGLDSGAVYVFVRSGTTWTQQAYLKPNAFGASKDKWFGYAVGISGDTIVVGAPFEDSSTLGINSTPNELADNAGAVYVFTRTGTAWSQQAYIKPQAVGTTQAGDSFGWAVAISGNTIAVGAPIEDGSATNPIDETQQDSGAAYVFTRTGTTWTQQAYFKAIGGGTIAGDLYGWSVGLHGDTLIVGAPFEGSSTLGVNSTANEAAPLAGAAYVYTRAPNGWSQQAYLKPAAVGTTQAGDRFGWAVAVYGDTAVVGAPFEDSSTTGVNSTPNELGNLSGAAYVFTRSGTTWTQQAYLKPAAVGTAQTDDRFGFSVAAYGEYVLIGAPGEASSTFGINSTPNDQTPESGAAYLFSRTGTTWAQTDYIKRSDNQDFKNVNFSYGVGLSGVTVIVGAPWDRNGKLGVNSTPDSATLSVDSGSAYVYTFNTLMNVDPTGPLAPAGPTQTFVFKYNNTGGATQFGVVNALINQYLNGDAACYIAYSQPLNVLYLVNDQGPGSGISAGLTLGATGSVSNSQCTVNSAGSSASISGGVLTLTLNITFKTAFLGNKVIYLAAQDQAGNSTGWITVGSTIVAEAAPTFPRSGTMTPSTGTTSSSVISFTYSDATTASNLQTAWALINFAIDGRNACYVAYYAPGNQLFLYPDSGDGNAATSIILTGTNTIENSQCRISAQGSSVTTSGGTLTLNLNYTFKAPFAGFKAIWTATQTLGGAATSAWKPVGGWKVP